MARSHMELNQRFSPNAIEVEGVRLRSCEICHALVNHARREAHLYWHDHQDEIVMSLNRQIQDLRGSPHG